MKNTDIRPYISLVDLRHLPASSSSSTKTTLAYQYYNDVSHIDRHLKVIEAWPIELRRKVILQIVDDHSSDPFPADIFTDIEGLEVHVYRVRDNIQWNQPGARNLNGYVARTDWILFSDFDHVFTAPNLETLLSRLPSLQQGVYWFPRMQQTEVLKHPPMGIFLVPTKIFLEIGGMDEDFSGMYGHDDSFFTHEIRRKNIPINVLDDIYAAVELSPARDLDRDVKLNWQKREMKVDKPEYRSYLALRFRWGTLTT